MGIGEQYQERSYQQGKRESFKFMSFSVDIFSRTAVTNWWVMRGIRGQAVFTVGFF